MRLFYIPIFLFFGLFFQLAISASFVFAQEDPKDIVATQVRAQGHKCESPKSATRDEADSIPDEPVWILKFEGSAYKVRLKPDMAANIERID